MTIKVLIIEDSKLMQEILFKIFSSDDEFEVVGTADDPLIAREIIKKHNPDVITLDVMLPHMDGITFLRNLMRLHPLPVVMISTLTEEGGAIALEALAIGAVDYLLKPTQGELKNLTRFSRQVIATVKNAAKANVVKSLDVTPVVDNSRLQKTIYQSDLLKDELIAIGASTGGVEAIETILLQLPRVLPPVVIVQHIKNEFGASFIKRIHKLYGLSVVEPVNLGELKPGSIYIATGGKHLEVRRQHNNFVSYLTDVPTVNGHKPSIDVLFSSVAKAAGSNAVGILLTGMGADGAKGLKAIRDAGGSTIVQDEESSVIWGMPGSAVKLGAAEHIVSLNNIPQKILQLIDEKMLGVKTN